MTILYFALSGPPGGQVAYLTHCAGLDILDALDTVDTPRVIEWIYSLQVSVAVQLTQGLMF